MVIVGSITVMEKLNMMANLKMDSGMGRENYMIAWENYYLKEVFIKGSPIDH
jgi:hypothetical protein